jgi:hypothetical protein
VANYIRLARNSGDDVDLERFAAAATQERNRALAEGAKSETDLRRVSPELAVAWCNAMLGLGNGNLERHSAIGIITAIEAFASNRRRPQHSAALRAVLAGVIRRGALQTRVT